MTQTTLDSRGKIIGKNVLLSFRGQFPYLIYVGVKKYEIRKSNINLAIPGRSIALIYEVKPIGKVTGFFQIGQIVPADPAFVIVNYDLDSETRRYIANLEVGKKVYVIVVGSSHRFRDSVPIRNPPRSWRYLTEEEDELFRERVVKPEFHEIKGAKP